MATGPVIATTATSPTALSNNFILDASRHVIIRNLVNASGDCKKSWRAEGS
jgi:hypothetical protein